MSEIKYHFEDNKFSDKFKFYNDRDKTRIQNMVRGDDDAVSDFQYLTHHSARGILTQDIPNHEAVEKIVELLPVSTDEVKINSITGFQLKDIMQDSFSLNDLMEGIKARIKENNDKDVFKKDPRIIADKALETKDELEEETEQEKLKRWGNPKVTLNEILKEFDLVETAKEKLKEIDYSDDILWYVDANELVGLLELKDFKKSK